MDGEKESMRVVVLNHIFAFNVFLCDMPIPIYYVIYGGMWGQPHKS